MSEAKQNGGAARVTRGGKRAEAERGFDSPAPVMDVVDLLEYRLRKTLAYVQQHGTLEGLR
jgi:hypothetical protein